MIYKTGLRIRDIPFKYPLIWCYSPLPFYEEISPSRSPQSLSICICILCFVSVDICVISWNSRESLVKLKIEKIRKTIWKTLSSVIKF